MGSAIEWCDDTWNPVSGCTRVSAGCDNCYAATMTRRLEAMGKADYTGLTTDKHFNGVVRVLPHKLGIPLRWKKPRMIFVNSMSDLFHPSVPFEFIAKCYATMMASPQHTFQILTKRPERVVEFEEWLRRERCGYIHGEFGFLADIAEVSDRDWKKVIRHYHGDERAGCIGDATAWPWPLPNVWLGTSVENQATADERIPHLLRCPAAVRFLSIEPLLGPVNLHACSNFSASGHGPSWLSPIPSGAGGMTSTIDWVIVGGESGPGARPMHPDWARSIRDQCQAAGVPFFFKQWGAFIWEHSPTYASPCQTKTSNSYVPVRVGKKQAGRLLDGREWNEIPQTVQEPTHA